MKNLIILFTIKIGCLYSQNSTNTGFNEPGGLSGNQSSNNNQNNGYQQNTSNSSFIQPGTQNSNSNWNNNNQNNGYQQNNTNSGYVQPTNQNSNNNWNNNSQNQNYGYQNSNNAYIIPDITNHFDQLLYQLFQEIDQVNQNSWVTNEDLIYDINLCHNNGVFSEEKWNRNYQFLKSTSKLIYKSTWMALNFGPFRKYDLKNGLYKQHNKSNDRNWVYYRGTQLRVEEIGNIFYGIAIKRLGFSQGYGTCAGGVAQILSNMCYSLYYLVTDYSKFKNKMNTMFTQKLRGSCLDNYRDTHYIQMGYQWY